MVNIKVYHRKNTSLFLKKLKAFVRKFKIASYLNIQRMNFRETSGENSQFQVEKCPFCGSINHKGNSKPYKLYISKKNKKFCCYVCGEEGSLIRFVARVEKATVASTLAKYVDSSVYEALPQHLISKLEDKFSARESTKIEELKEMPLPKEFVPMFIRARNFGQASQYLTDRGFLDSYDIGVSPQKIGQELDIRYCDNWKMERKGKKPLFIRKRIIFPIWFEGKVVGWQGRDVTGKAGLKYYISEGFKKARVLWRYDQIFDAEEITFCEGVFDGIKCWSHNPSCFFGKTLSEEQISLLQKMPNLKRIILALDPDTKFPDENGNIPFDKVAEQLKAFWDVYTIDLGEYKDCGEAKYAEMKIILNNKQPYKRKLISSLK